MRYRCLSGIRGPRGGGEDVALSLSLGMLVGLAWIRLEIHVEEKLRGASIECGDSDGAIGAAR